MAHGRTWLSPPPYSAIPLTPVPGITLLVDPFGMQAGAVNFNNSAQLFGPSAIPIASRFLHLVQFTQGVLSFWMRYDSSASADGAKIYQTQFDLTTNSNKLLDCVANPLSSPSVSPPQPKIGCLGMTADPVQMNFVLQDLTGKGLVSVAVPYVQGNTFSLSNQWERVGTFPELVVTGGQTFNGVTWTPPSTNTFIVSPCGGSQLYQHTGTSINTNPRADGGSDWVLSLPSNPVFGQTALLLTGPIGIYDRFSVPADVYAFSTTFTGGNPTSGWHHYIFSFDASQLVTDANGSQTIRVQAAIDGVGGPVAGGPLFDTKATGVTLASQPFPNWTAQASATGTLQITDTDAWTIAAPTDASVDFAYCYFGISAAGEGFYDLTQGANIQRFRTPQGQAANLGRSGIAIPLECIFMHTGDMGSGNIGTPLSPIVAPRFPINAAQPFIPNPSGGSGNVFSPWLKVGRLSSTDGPPINFTLSF